MHEHLFDVGQTKPIPVVEIPPEPPKPEIPDPTEPMEFEPPVAGATLSPCGKYRYTLFRKFKNTGKKILFVGVNPSTANATDDDATVRRWISFAKREDCAEMWVGNISPFRATNPGELSKPESYVPPSIQMVNTEALHQMANDADMIVACWGNNISLIMGAHYDVERFINGREVLCFGLTASKHPKHPLRIRNDTPLVPYQYTPVATREEEDFE